MISVVTIQFSLESVSKHSQINKEQKTNTSGYQFKHLTWTASNVNNPYLAKIQYLNTG